MDKEALNRTIATLIAKHEGDFTSVQDALITQMGKNPDLLLAIALPHLKGITAHAIQSVATKIAKGKMTLDGKETGRARASATQTPQPEKIAEKLGLEMLKNMAVGKPAKFGLEKPEAFGQPRTASDAHIQAIHKIAKGKI